MMLHGQPSAQRQSRVGCGSAVLVLIGLLAVAPPARAHEGRDNKHSERRQVESLEEQLRVAEISGDVPTMDRLLSDDFVGISMSGELNTKAQQLDRIRSRSLVLTHLQLQDIHVKLLGKVAVVTGRAQVDGTSAGVPLRGSFRYTRVYLHQPGGAWKITNFEVTRIPS